MNRRSDKPFNRDSRKTGERGGKRQTVSKIGISYGSNFNQVKLGDKPKRQRVRGGDSDQSDWITGSGLAAGQDFSAKTWFKDGSNDFEKRSFTPNHLRDDRGSFDSKPRINNNKFEGKSQDRSPRSFDRSRGPRSDNRTSNYGGERRETRPDSRMTGFGRDARSGGRDDSRPSRFNEGRRDDRNDTRGGGYQGNNAYKPRTSGSSYADRNGSNGPREGGRPSFGDSRPPREDGRPSFGDSRPPREGGRPSFGDSRPPREGGRPSFGDSRPPREGGRPSFGDSRPQREGGRPSFGDSRLPREGGSTEKGYRGPNNNRSEYYTHRDNRRSDNRKTGGYERRDGDQRFDRSKRFESNYNDKNKYQQPEDPKDITLNELWPIRLNRYIAMSGVCSRREADDLIKDGKVRVNGTVVEEMGHRVIETDEVTYNKKVLKISKYNVYILLNKPKDYITTSDDEKGRKTVLDLINGATNERVYPVGRLDRNTTGLLLLTNDGDLTQKLTHPSSEISKIYQVTLDKPLNSKDFETIKNGIELEDGPIKVDDIAFLDPMDAKEIGVELHSGRNRIVRRIFESLDYQVEKLDRITFAGLTKKDIPRGKWRLLNAKEIGLLTKSKGININF